MFTGHEEHEIAFDTGAEMTQRFRNAFPEAKKGGYISKDAIESLLKQDGCVGIRIYFAQYDGGEMTMVLVGVTSNENDLIGEGSVCINSCLPCPDYCGDNDILNTDQ